MINDAGGSTAAKSARSTTRRHKPQDAVANTRKLVEQDRIFAVIAPQGTPPGWRRSSTWKNRVPLLFPFQARPSARKKYASAA